MLTVLSTAYFPPALWVAHAVQGHGLLLEAHESFQKQSYRSRTEIAGPNGRQILSVPVDRSIKRNTFHSSVLRRAVGEKSSQIDRNSVFERAFL